METISVTWEQLEKEYNIKFRLENGEFRPVQRTHKF